jgi:MFS transporter, DHA1 family, multidrug resistance protein
VGPAFSLVRLSAVAFVAYCSYSICRTPLLPLFARELGAEPALIGFVVGASTLTGIVVKLPAGAWSDLLGRRPLLLAGAIVFATLPFTYLAVSTVTALVLVRFVHGSATALFGPVASASLSDVAPASSRGAWLSTYSTAQGAGQAMGPVLAGYLVAAHRFDLAFIAAGVIGLAAPLIVAGWRGPSWDRAGLGRCVEREERSGALGPPRATSVAGYRGPRHSREERSGALGPPRATSLAGYGGPRRAREEFTRGIAEVARDRLVLATSGAQAAQFMLNGTLNAFLPLYGREVLGLTVPQLGWLFGLQTITTLAVRPVIGVLSDRAGRRWVIVTGLLMCSSAVLLVSIVDSLAELVAAIVAYAAGVATTTAATSAYITDVARRARYGAAHGVFGTIYDVGDALGPIGAGFLVAAVGYARMFQIMALVAVTMAVGFSLSSRAARNGALASRR